MEQMFISGLTIEKVRHLENITIPLSNEKPKHLLFTGKNGSGKTSVLEAMSGYLHVLVRNKLNGTVQRLFIRMLWRSYKARGLEMVKS